MGTSTAKEAKEYFSDMGRHRIKFKYNNDQDDYSINLAFSKKEIESRKDWLTNWMEECKRRKELGLSEIYLYEKDTKAVSYQAGFIFEHLARDPRFDNVTRRPGYSRGPSGFLPVAR